MDALLQGLLFGFTLTILAGPILFALVQTGIEQGFRAGMMVAFGVFFSDVLFVTAVYFGLSYIQKIVKLDGFNLTLGIAGGIALILIGIATFFTKPPEVPENDFFSKNENSDNLRQKLTQRTSSIFALFTKGFIVNTLNPFTFFFWGVVAAGKMAESNFSQNEFFLFFGGILFVIIVSDTLKVYAAKTIRKFLKPEKILLVRKIAGAAFVAFGVVLMVRVMI